MTAARSTTKRKKAAAKKRAAKSSAKSPAGRKRASRPKKKGKSPIERLEDQLPATLAQFSRRLRARLTQLENRIEKAEERYRRGWTKLLRDGSHQLGLLEARGEQQWRKLTLQARRDVVKLLQRLEKALEPPSPDSETRGTKAARKKTAAKTAVRTRAAPRRAPVENAAGRGRGLGKEPAERGGASYYESVFGREDSAIEDLEADEEPDDAYTEDLEDHEEDEEEEEEEEDLDELLKRGF